MIGEELERHDLLVLDAGLSFSGPDTEVDCTLRRTTQGEPLGRWRFPASDMGLPQKIERSMALYQGYPFQIPDALLAPLRGWVDRQPRDRPLWLHLVKPYGYLGLVPWEQLLQPQLGRPVLRLPDFLARPPRETASTLDVILCGSAPISEQSFGLVDRLVRMADRILEAVRPRQATLHVFTDREIHDTLRQAWESRGLLGDRVRLHSPESAEPYAIPDPTSRVTDPGGHLESPWLLWMRDSLGGRSVDVVHFLCHGYLSRDRGALQLAESPLVNQDQRMSRLVGAPELTTFLTQVGAWSAALTSPENNYSEMGLRLFADHLAQARPGPVLHQEARLDPDDAALAEAYRFLYSREPRPAPASAALALYCQPSRVAEPALPLTRGGFSVKGVKEAVPADDALQVVFETEENVPSWVAATERYVEKLNVRLGERPATKLSATRGMKDSDTDSARDTLRQIQEIVANAAREAKGGGGR
jgi:hypothetical protein